MGVGDEGARRLGLFILLAILILDGILCVPLNSVGVYQRKLKEEILLSL